VLVIDLVLDLLYRMNMAYGVEGNGAVSEGVPCGSAASVLTQLLRARGGGAPRQAPGSCFPTHALATARLLHQVSWLDLI
jgi:hypothetical protein